MISVSQIVQIQQFANALYGMQVGSETLAALEQQMSSQGNSLPDLFNVYYERSFASLTPEQVATLLVERLGVSSAGSAVATNYIVGQLSGTPVAERGAKVVQMLDLYSGLTADAMFGTTAAAWNTKVATATAYVGSTDLLVGVGRTFNLDSQSQKVTGTVFDDLFQKTAGSGGGSVGNTFNGVDGLAGQDKLEITLQNPSASLANDPGLGLVSINVETVQVSAVHTAESLAQSAQTQAATKLDAQRVAGVDRWVNQGSNTDLKIDDVRILDNQTTSDVTLEMRDTAAGDVDFEVYFDANSVRGFTYGDSKIALELINTRAVVAGQAPLQSLLYDSFTFTLTDTILGTSQVVQLRSRNINDAQTYPELVVAFQKAADELLGAGVLTVALGKDFTVIDTRSAQPVVGQQIELRAALPLLLTTPPGSGWSAPAGLIPITEGYTNYTTDKESSDPIISRILLDNVGLGGTSGDLIVGNLASGNYKTEGIDQFEIEIQGNSKLQTISSNSSSLRKIKFFNSAASSSDSGGISVNGKPSDAQATSFGFSDIAEIDGSAMRGAVDFTAEVTSTFATKLIETSLARDDIPYGINLPKLKYQGGQANDSITIQIDSSSTSRQAWQAAYEDFSFSLAGNEGDDTLTAVVAISSNDANANAWYQDQQYMFYREQYAFEDNKWISNLNILGGDGNDTIRKPSWGNFVINAGSGNDTVYSDNSGGSLKSLWLVSHDKSIAPQLGGTGGNQVTNLQAVAANNAPLFLYKGQLTVSFSGGQSSGGWASTVDITPMQSQAGAWAIDQQSINQAIKRAINEDAVLSKLLLATDGPGNTLQITSLIDGQLRADDLDFTITAPSSSSATGGLNVLSTAEAADAQSAFQEFLRIPSNPSPGASWENANVSTIAAVDTRLSTGLTFADVGLRSNAQTDNAVELGTGNDVAVLSSSAQANEALYLSGYELGQDSVVNFDDGSSVAGMTGLDHLDLQNYLDGIAGTDPFNTARISTTSNTNAIAELNEVVVLNTIDFNPSFTFSGLTADKLRSALNGSAGLTDYAGITGGTLNAQTGQSLTAQIHTPDYTSANSNKAIVQTAPIRGSTGNAVLIIENDDNLGEYALFHLIWNTDSTTNTNREFSQVNLIGVMDFGSSVNFTLDNYITRYVMEGVLL